MNSLLLMTLMMFGQCECRPTQSLTHFGRATSQVYYRLGDLVEERRHYEYVHYKSGWKNVPIINGYAPRVLTTIYDNGNTQIIYDYREKFLLSDVMVWEEQKVMPKIPQKVLPKKDEDPFTDSNPLMQRPSEVLD